MRKSPPKVWRCVFKWDLDQFHGRVDKRRYPAQAVFHRVERSSELIKIMGEWEALSGRQSATPDVVGPQR